MLCTLSINMYNLCDEQKLFIHIGLSLTYVQRWWVCRHRCTKRPAMKKTVKTLNQPHSCSHWGPCSRYVVILGSLECIHSRHVSEDHRDLVVIVQDTPTAITQLSHTAIGRFNNSLNFTRRGGTKLTVPLQMICRFLCTLVRSLTWHP